ncbi:hypothetical protein [Mycolicibacterium stellerae]|uniref:hypothetical protein n=1 Tax=Mycolicibacterium stellerae TaxID=2358193 RepID=UPI000F0B107A|nr:hypothetical protein [Mycolicibacterium stellerae]
MGMIGVDSASLGSLGAECECRAGAGVSSAPAVSGGFGATAAAVRALHSDIDEAARLIADRLQLTGGMVSSAARGFAAAEAANEDMLYEV